MTQLMREKQPETAYNTQTEQPVTACNTQIEQRNFEKEKRK